MPFEIGCIFYGMFSAIIIGIDYSLVTVTLNDKAKDLLKYLRISSSFDNTVIYFANLSLWIITIYFILSGMTYLKQTSEYGFKKYLKERVLFVRIVRFALRKVEDGLDYLSHIDLSDKSNRVIIKVLIINFLVISAISVIWVFGIFAAIVYNIILFILIRKYYDKVRENYSALLKATNKIAHGNLDFEINEDLGLFNPFKDELKKIQSGFKRAVDEEVKSQKMKTELISNVSHDLKTPLTSIITYVDLLKKDDITEEERKSYIDTIDKKSQRLKYLIEDLFEVSKATSGNIKLNIVNVDIVELIKQVEFELSDKLDNAEVIVKNNFPDNKVILKLDSQKTFRVFENLLNNVAKYSMPKSRVYVNVNENTDTVEIEIKNMSAVEIDYKAEEIMERFQRGDKSRNTEGSGLGLAIVKSFVEAQGGTFKVELDGDLFKAVINFRKKN
ncbi:MAG: sensor histidine kinase, partial [Clostridium sp.]